MSSQRSFWMALMWHTGSMRDTSSTLTSGTHCAQHALAFVMTHYFEARGPFASRQYPSGGMAVPSRSLAAFRDLGKPPSTDARCNERARQEEA